MRRILYMQSIVLAVTILFCLFCETAVAAPPEKPGNPGVPGLLAEISELNDIVTDQQEIIDQQIARIEELEEMLSQLKNFAPVARSGQTDFYADGDDGDLQKGKPWPVPRFSDNQDGTVTDNLTELIWLKNVDCLGDLKLMTWSEALTEANNLAEGQCGLTDSSAPGDWRLPNVRELLSLIHYAFTWPALPDTTGTGQCSDGDPFIVWGNRYWSSTSYVPGFAWSVGIHDGSLIYNSKDGGYRVWPVRDAK